MSLKARTILLSALVDKANKKIKPLLDEYHEVIKTYEEAISDLVERVSSINKEIELAKQRGQELLTGLLEEKIKDLQEQQLAKLNKFTQTQVESLNKFLVNINEDIDGVNIKLTNKDSITDLGISVEPDLFNLTTEFLKNTIEDPTTVAVISTAVSGTAGPYTVIGTGTQLAPIKIT